MKNRTAKLTISSILTLSRLLLTPFVVKAIIENNWKTAVFLFLIAVITDLFDGALARFLRDESKLGAFLDPLADKVLIVSSYFALIFSGISSKLLPFWLILIISIKELALISGMIYLIIWSKKRLGSILEIRVTWAGKLAMTVQSVYLFTLMIILAAEIYIPLEIFQALQFIILTLVLVTLAQYAYIALRNIFAIMGISW